MNDESPTVKKLLGESRKKSWMGLHVGKAGVSPAWN